MKKLFVSMLAMAMMVTSSTLNAQDEAEAQAVETVAAATETVPSEEGTAVVEAQEVVSEGVAVAEVPLPVAEGVIYDAGVFTGGFVSADCGCGPIQPIGFNQPIIAQSSFSQPIPSSAVSIVNPAQAPVSVSVPVSSPAPLATFTSAPVTSGCSSCNGGVVEYAPAPLATSFNSPNVSECCVSAPASVGSVGCSSCGVSAAPVARNSRQNTRRFLQGGIFRRLRNAAIVSAIDD